MDSSEEVVLNFANALFQVMIQPHNRHMPFPMIIAALVVTIHDRT